MKTVQDESVRADIVKEPLRANAADRAADRSSAQPLESAIRDRIATLLAGKLGCGPEYVDDHRRFDTYGLASIDAIDMMGDLEAFLELELSPTLLNDFPTVAELSARLTTLARAR